MADLNGHQLKTLSDFARKKAGEAVGFVNIADAIALTELGFAQRSHEGWDITPAGTALLAGRADRPPEQPKTVRLGPGANRNGDGNDGGLG